MNKYTIKNNSEYQIKIQFSLGFESVNARFVNNSFELRKLKFKMNSETEEHFEIEMWNNSQKFKLDLEISLKIKNASKE